MSKKASNMDSLLVAFSKYLSPHEINASRILGEISSTITSERIKRNLNQKEFSEFMGVSQGMVSKWESKNYNFTIESLSKIFDKLDIEFDVLLAPSEVDKYAAVHFENNEYTAPEEFKLIENGKLLEAS